MTDSDNNDAARLIREFMAGNETPITDDWKKLIDANPLHAGAIADAAIQYGGIQLFQEGRRSASEIDTTFRSTIDDVLDTVHRTPSTLLLDTKAKVDATLGPKCRKLAADVGIGPYAALLNGVLVGRIVAPISILRALSQQFESSVAVLSEVFARNFSESELPAFKSTEGQPHVETRPQSWEQSVRAMQLSTDEEDRLLRFLTQD